MIVEIAARSGGEQWTFRFQIAEQWQPLEQLIETTQPELLAALEQAGLATTIPTSPDGEVLFAGALLAVLDEDEPPLMASLQVIEGPGGFTGPLAPGDEISPERSEGEFDLEWPTGVGIVTYRRVHYVLPTPDVARSLVFTFTTPNRPEPAVMDAVFDTVVGSGQFYVPEPA